LYWIFNVFVNHGRLLYKLCYKGFKFDLKKTKKVYSQLDEFQKNFYNLLTIFSRIGICCGGFLTIERKFIDEESKPILNKEIVIDIHEEEIEKKVEEEMIDKEDEELLKEIRKLQNDPIIKEKPPCIIISNHLSMVDILFTLEEFGMTSFVSRANVADFLFFGNFLKQIECILVKPGSKVQKEILKRQLDYYQNVTSQRLVIYPEGTTTNGRFLIPFKKGAFMAGLPVQIMIINQKWEHFQPSWETIPEFEYYYRLFTQFRNYVEITHLPIYYPSEDEKKDPELYAENVRKLMAKVSNLELSSSTREDKMEFHKRIHSGELHWEKRYFE
jgi:1-acyl-sn-glycerol-3-phosphate acyltransferase